MVKNPKKALEGFPMMSKQINDFMQKKAHECWYRKVNAIYAGIVNQVGKKNI